MDQSESNNNKKALSGVQEVVLPKRSFSVELVVGLFMVAALACLAYLAVGLGDVELFGSNTYYISAEFDNISGLQMGSSVEVAGVKIGQVVDISLEDPSALVKMRLDKSLRIKEDDVASIRTKGIIGDRYVKISRGGSEKYLPENGRMSETESTVDIEDVIGKIVHNLGGSEEKSGKTDE
jgi:phospholipid/cholesterol/gamma-HCH transport system substrate-binding protein